MLRKFVQGLMFGAGFGVAFAAVWIVSFSYILPEVIDFGYKEPEFSNPRVAEVVTTKDSKLPAPAKPTEYRFFKHHERMKIPAGGGILAMSPMPQKAGEHRPATYQLWLTSSELWQIRTIEDKVEVEKLPYPDDASVETLYKLMNERLGVYAGQATMTVSADEISRIRSGARSTRDRALNGKLSVTTDGVVFVLPGPYET